MPGLNYTITPCELVTWHTQEEEERGWFGGTLRKLSPEGMSWCVSVTEV